MDARDKIKRMCRAKDWTLHKVATKAGVCYSSLWNCIHKGRPLNKDAALKMVNFLHKEGALDGTFLDAVCELIFLKGEKEAWPLLQK